jgi:stage V sporulation protein R
MSDWNIKLLEEYDEKISVLAKAHGLDWFPIQYEVCDYYSMIGHMAYHGMPTYYGHWSFGKSFEMIHGKYNAGATGLPYELIINSDPSIAYLMRDNPAHLQLLIMCHCVGHSDFFKNNRMFKHTSPETVVMRFRNAKKRIKKYIEDVDIGVREVEKTLDAAHAIQFQVNKFNMKKLTDVELRQKYTDVMNNDTTGTWKDFEINKIPLEPDHDLLQFIAKYSRKLKPWQRDLLEIVHEHAMYFIPQMQTKIMNEGFACWTHYKLMHELDLEQKYHIPFLKSHNQVVRPHLGAINPYHLGFHLMNKIEERHGKEEVLLARETAYDSSFISRYLLQEDCEELGLFTYSKKKRDTTVDDVSDEDGWKRVRDDLAQSVGGGTLPVIYADEITRDYALVLRHAHDGRDLELDYADACVKHIRYLWGDDIKLYTVIEDEQWEF